MTIICNKSNWEEINQYLLRKDWTFYDSEKGDEEKYNTITWSYEKDNYSDKAQGWLHLYTFEGFPNKIIFSFTNKDHYNSIQRSLSTFEFRLKGSEILDNAVKSTYVNNSYNLSISSEKIVDEGYSSRSITSYIISLVKKEGVYDPDNGPKKELDDNGRLKAEYTLLNGELNGKITIYHPNGRIMKTGNYINGKRSGIFVEFDENGEKTSEYVTSNDLKNGIFKFFENGKLSYSLTYKNDVKSGPFIKYIYNSDTLALLRKGFYLDNEMDGQWTWFYDSKPKQKIIEIVNYERGIKNGPFLETSGDSVIVGRYYKNEFNGNYRAYTDVSRMIFGGVINTDTAELALLCKGQYKNGLKTGLWRHYDFTGSLRSTGEYINDEKNGEWRYYFTKMVDDKGKELSYSGKLYLIQNYSKGKQEGKETRFAYLEEVKFPCSKQDTNANSLDTCSKYVYHQILENSFYKNDLLNGSYEVKDSANKLISKGIYINNLKEGEWFERYWDKAFDGTVSFTYQNGSYKNNLREGRWIQYYTEDKVSDSFNYQNGLLNGTYTVWNNFNKPSEQKQFTKGKLTELVTFDSLGVTAQNKYEILNEKENEFYCRATNFREDGNESQVYWVSKNGEINHHWFELDFLIKTGKLSNDKTGYKDGEYKLVNKEGKPLIVGSLYKESKVGQWVFYYYDQNVKIVTDYKDDNIDSEKYYNLAGDPFTGEFKIVDAEKSITEIRKIKKGLRNGITSFIDNNTGKSIRKESYSSGKLK
jgi:antitoxin component YwqK of YwqJK toxin-antitoxin module